MISVIIPIYNNIGHLKDCLDSVVAQSYKDLEIILVDDGSDTSVAKEINEIGRGLKVIHAPHAGAGAARNRGFSESRGTLSVPNSHAERGGELVFFCDADVILRADCLEMMTAALAAHPEAAYVYSDYNLGCKKMPGRIFDGAALKKINYISTMSLIRREDFVGFDESLKRFQDWDLWLTLLEKGKIGVYIPESLFCAHPPLRPGFGGRAGGGMSKWRPGFWYKLFPWAKSVREYSGAREVVLGKHHLEL